MATSEEERLLLQSFGSMPMDLYMGNQPAYLANKTPQTGQSKLPSGLLEIAEQAQNGTLPQIPSLNADLVDTLMDQGLPPGQVMEMAMTQAVAMTEKELVKAEQARQTDEAARVNAASQIATVYPETYFNPELSAVTNAANVFNVKLVDVQNKIASEANLADADAVIEEHKPQEVKKTWEEFVEAFSNETGKVAKTVADRKKRTESDVEAAIGDIKRRWEGGYLDEKGAEIELAAIKVDDFASIVNDWLEAWGETPGTLYHQFRHGESRDEGRWMTLLERWYKSQEIQTEGEDESEWRSRWEASASATFKDWVRERDNLGRELNLYDEPTNQTGEVTRTEGLGSDEPSSGGNGSGAASSLTSDQWNAFKVGGNYNSVVFGRYADPFAAAFRSVAMKKLGPTKAYRPEYMNAAMRGYPNALGHLLFKNLTDLSETENWHGRSEEDKRKGSFYNVLDSGAPATAEEIARWWPALVLASSRLYTTDDPTGWAKGTQYEGLSDEVKMYISLVVENPKYENAIVAAREGLTGRGHVGGMLLDGLNRRKVHWENTQLRDPDAPWGGFIAFHDKDRAGEKTVSTTEGLAGSSDAGYPGMSGGPDF